MIKYDFDKHTIRTGTSSVKWDKPFSTIHPDVLPLWVADMDFACSHPIQERLHASVNQEIYGYHLGYDPTYRKAVCGWYRRRFEWNINPKSIFYAPGIVAAIAYLIHLFSDVGDGIVIQTPVYYPFRQKIEASHRKVIENPLIYNEGMYTMNYEELDILLSNDNIKGMILCSPHNPVGRVWQKDELENVVKIAQKYKKWIVSDEIHGDLIRQGLQHHPLHTICPSYQDEIFTCTSPSKSFNLAGLQNSNIIITKPSYQACWKEYVQEQLVLQAPSAFAIAATKAAYNESEDWLNQVNSYIDSNIAFATQYLHDHLPKANVSPCEGTYLLWVNVNAYCHDPYELEQKMLAAGVILDEGYIFGKQGIGYERLNVACPRNIVEACLKRMVDTLR